MALEALAETALEVFAESQKHHVEGDLELAARQQRGLDSAREAAQRLADELRRTKASLDVASADPEACARSEDGFGGAAASEALSEMARELAQARGKLVEQARELAQVRGKQVELDAAMREREEEVAELRALSEGLRIRAARAEREAHVHKDAAGSPRESPSTAAPTLQQAAPRQSPSNATPPLQQATAPPHPAFCTPVFSSSALLTANTADDQVPATFKPSRSPPQALLPPAAPPPAGPLEMEQPPAQPRSAAALQMASPRSSTPDNERAPTPPSAPPWAPPLAPPWAPPMAAPLPPPVSPPVDLAPSSGSCAPEAAPRTAQSSQPSPPKRTPSSGSVQFNKEAARMEAAAEAAAWVAAVTSTAPPRSGENTKEAYALISTWLRSGELLCELINHVKPGAVKQVAASTMPFKQMENIAHYLDACAALGVPAHDQFQTVDLFDGRGVDAVVRNLHSLGRVAQTIDTFRGPQLGAKLAERNARQFSEQQLAEARAAPARWTNMGKALPASPLRADSGVDESE